MQSTPRASFDTPLLNVNCAMTVTQAQWPRLKGACASVQLPGGWRSSLFWEISFLGYTVRWILSYQVDLRCYPTPTLFYCKFPPGKTSDSFLVGQKCAWCKMQAEHGQVQKLELVSFPAFILRERLRLPGCWEAWFLWFVCSWACLRASRVLFYPVSPHLCEVLVQWLVCVGM